MTGVQILAWACLITFYLLAIYGGLVQSSSVH